MNVTSGPRVGAIAAAAILALLVVGCAPEQEPRPEPAEPQEPAAGDGLAGDTECIIGDWSLDVDDYRAQSEAYLLSLGIPLEAFDLTGTQIVSITEVSFLITTSMTSYATVHGVGLTEPHESSGGGEWAWDADDPTVLSIENWAWGIEPPAATDSPAAPPLIDPDSPASVTCWGDQLILQGVGAPLVGRFVRVS